MHINNRECVKPGAKWRTAKGMLGASQVKLVVKNSPASAGDRREAGSIPESGRSPGGGQAPHSSILAWRIPWTEEPGGLQSMGSQGVGDD